MCLLALSRSPGHDAEMAVHWLPEHRPEWAGWRTAAQPWAVRISEDVMAVEPVSGALSTLGNGVVDRLCPLLGTHLVDDALGSALRLTTSWHATTVEAAAESAVFRAEVLTDLGSEHGLNAVASGTHPWGEARRSPR